MNYSCEVYGKFIKPKSKYKHFKSSLHKDFDKINRMHLIIEIPDINNVDEVFYAYIMEHNKKYEL